MIIFPHFLRFLPLLISSMHICRAFICFVHLSSSTLLSICSGWLWCVGLRVCVFGVVVDDASGDVFVEKEIRNRAAYHRIRNLRHCSPCNKPRRLQHPSSFPSLLRTSAESESYSTPRLVPTEHRMRAVDSCSHPFAWNTMLQRVA
jgi:hypothetical protein